MEENQNNVYPVAPFNKAVNSYLPYALDYNYIYRSVGLEKHILKRHPECAEYLQYLSFIIAHPDYIGVNPNESGTSFELVKVFDKNIQIGIDCAVIITQIPGKIEGSGMGKGAHSAMPGGKPVADPGNFVEHGGAEKVVLAVEHGCSFLWAREFTQKAASGRIRPFCGFSVFLLLQLNYGFIPHFGSFVAEEVNHSCGNVSKTELTVICLYCVIFRIEIIVNYAGNGVECMTCL